MVAESILSFKITLANTYIKLVLSLLKIIPFTTTSRKTMMIIDRRSLCNNREELGAKLSMATEEKVKIRFIEEWKII